MYALVLQSNLKTETLKKLSLFCLAALCPPQGCPTLKYSAVDIAKL